MKKFILIISIAALSACTNSSDAERALINAGYSDIELTGYNLLACGKEDTFSTGFIATNPSGKRVSGTVCSGLLFKGATIRF